MTAADGSSYENAIRIITAKLFDRDWNEELTAEEAAGYDTIAETLLRVYGWESMLKGAIDYLHKRCRDPESVINFAHLFWHYGWYDRDIPEPYDFLAYFYYVIDFKTKEYDGQGILLRLTTTILPNEGYMNANPILHPDYTPERDVKMINAVYKYKILMGKL